MGSCVLDPTNYSSNTTNDNPACQIASITNDNPQCQEIDLGRACENAYEPQSRTRQNCWNEPYTGEQTVGLRFQSAAIPEGATILWADLELTVDVENTAQADVVIHGEGSANSVQFQSTLNNISSRTATASSVTWNDMLAPAANETLISPNLAPVVQEIVDLGGWTEGNALTVMLTDDPSVGNIADRLIRSHDDSSTLAPRLRVWFAEGAGDAQTVGLRFSDVSVPQGAQIESAFLEFRVAQSTQEPSDITIHGELNVAPRELRVVPGR